MSQGRMGWARPWLITVAVALATATVGAALAQDAAPGGRGKATSKSRRGSKANKANKADKANKKGGPAAVAPLAKAVENPFTKAAASETSHYKFKMYVAGETALAATYYPAKLGTTDPVAPVVLLIHEKDRSGKDFEEAIGELKGQGLAEHLQGVGFAVLVIDLRGHGANPRRALSAKDWRAMTGDLQASYLFLLDRHNHGELNLNKLGVVAVGEGADLAAAWAATPGAAVSTDGRNSDLGALVLVSPTAIEGRKGLESVLTTLAPRVPLLLMVGQSDTDSNASVKAVTPFVERARTSKIELFPSSLHGYKLLRLEPKAALVVTRFLDSTLKARADEWEPRYNLNPIAFADIQVVRNTPAKAKDAPAKAKEKAKGAPPEKDAPPAKAKEKAKDAPPEKKDAPR